MSSSSILAVLYLSMLLAACSVPPTPAETTAVGPAETAVFPTHWPASSPPSTRTTAPPDGPTSTQALPTATSQPVMQICSPLKDFSLAQTSDITSNPYLPPAPGSDDPHQGVDLADRLPGSQVATTGREVQAVLAGQVAAIIQDRFPYGNAILIETQMEEQPADGWEQMQIPSAAPTLALLSPLTCPPVQELAFPNLSRRSLYLLYAHLHKPTNLRVEDQVACGQTIGAVGSSGNALNPHLHFEVRVGPSGLRLESMAHYDASATPQEMSNYCLWRISGLFQLVDPLKVLLYESFR